MPQKKRTLLKNKGGKYVEILNTFHNKKLAVAGNDAYSNIRVMIVGTGNIIGEEDAIKERYYSTSVSCFS